MGAGPVPPGSDTRSRKHLLILREYVSHYLIVHMNELERKKGRTLRCHGQRKNLQPGTEQKQVKKKGGGCLQLSHVQGLRAGVVSGLPEPGFVHQQQLPSGHCPQELGMQR